MSQGMRIARRNGDAHVVHGRLNFTKKTQTTLQFEENDKFVATGFSHPSMKIITREGDIEQMYWGILPEYVTSRQRAKEVWDSQSTLIARGETMFTLKSFRDAAANGRCIIPLTGYFEHHYRGGKKIPFFIHQAENKVFFVGGIWRSWTSFESGKTVKTFAVVTTPANELAGKIHNNPSRGGESRMPLILDEEQARRWLQGTDEEAAGLISPNTTVKLDAYPVTSLSGKEALGNCEQALEQKFYGNLGELFRD